MTHRQPGFMTAAVVFLLVCIAALLVGAAMLLTGWGLSSQGSRE